MTNIVSLGSATIFRVPPNPYNEKGTIEAADLFNGVIILKSDPKYDYYTSVMRERFLLCDKFKLEARVKELEAKIEGAAEGAAE